MPKSENLVERIYKQLKDEIFDFRLLPGDRFTEGEVAGRVKASRTPVREALFRLQQEGYLEVSFRSGWQVRPFDFRLFEELYELRILLENEALRRLCLSDRYERRRELADLVEFWMVPAEKRIVEGERIFAQDELFHDTLVATIGNREMLKIHRSVTERIRILRRLDFTEAGRLLATYDQHAEILRLLLEGDGPGASAELGRHIEQSKSEVRNISLHKLHEARRPVE